MCLIKGKEDLSEEQEKDMLDYLYTTQYQMRGILSISLGHSYFLFDFCINIIRAVSFCFTRAMWNFSRGLVFVALMSGLICLC